jgi:hypothetical protein
VSITRAILLLLLLALLVGVNAQPPVDETWLTVRPVTVDGGPLPGKVAINLLRAVNGQDLPVYARVTPEDDGTFTMLKLLPGSYKITLSFPEFDLVDATRSFEMQAGPNLLTWPLPPIFSVPFTYRVAGETVVPKDVQLYLQVDKSATVTRVIPPVKDGAPRLLLFAGTYHFFALTDRGYADADLVLKGGQKDAPQTLALQAGGTVEITVTNAKGKPIPRATVTLTRALRADFVLTVLLTTDDDGHAISSPLPPGAWKWVAAIRGYRQDDDTVTVTAGTTVKAEALLLRP